MCLFQIRRTRGMFVARWPSFTRLRDKYCAQLSAVVVSPRILVANVTMLFNSESRVDRNFIYFEVNKLKTFPLSLASCSNIRVLTLLKFIAKLGNNITLTSSNFARPSGNSQFPSKCGQRTATLRGFSQNRSGRPRPSLRCSCILMLE